MLTEPGPVLAERSSSDVPRIAVTRRRADRTNHTYTAARDDGTTRMRERQDEQPRDDEDPLARDRHTEGPFRIRKRSLTCRSKLPANPAADHLRWPRESPSGPAFPHAQPRPRSGSGRPAVRSRATASRSTCGSAGTCGFVMTGPDVRSPVDTMFTEVVENELLAGEMEAAGVPGVAGPVRVHLRHKNESNAVRWTCFCVKGLRCGRRGRVRAGHGSAGPG